MNDVGQTPLLFAADKAIADLLRKHGAKTGEELKAAGNYTTSHHHLTAFEF